MSIYVASTVFGGLVGRIFSGFIATNFSYEYVFYSLSVGLLISLFYVLVVVVSLLLYGSGYPLLQKLKSHTSSLLYIFQLSKEVEAYLLHLGIYMIYYFLFELHGK